MKLRLVGIMIGAVAVICLIFWLTRSHESEVLLSSGVALTPEWQKITAPRILKTEAPWSEVLIEIPSLHVRKVDNRLVLDDGTSLNVDAYLVKEDAKEIKLDKVGPVVFGTNVVLKLSSDALQWKTPNYRFRALALRSNKLVATGRIIWMSYDPSTTKDGVGVPRALM